MYILLLFIAALSCILLFLIFPKFTQNEPSFKAPPGPKGLPFIGNLHQYDFLAPHVYLAKLGNTYGSIVSLRLGCAHMVVVQSAKLAKDILQTQDLNFCSRPSMVGIRKLSYNGLDIAFSPYNEYFREVKKISVVHLLNSIRVRSFAPIQQEQIAMLMSRISSLSSASTAVNLSRLVTDFACTNICKIAFGRSYEDEEGCRNKIRRLLDEAEVMFIDLAYSDYFPYLGWLDKLTGKSGRLDKTFRDLDEFYEQIIRDHLSPSNHGNNKQEDLIDVLLHLRKERSFAFDLTLDHVKAILMREYFVVQSLRDELTWIQYPAIQNIFIAGTDTSSAMVIWAMTELLKHPEAMNKVQDELKNATLKGDYITEDDLQDKEYFKAIVKETFRLHPASPLLVAHQAIRKSKIKGYDIRPETIVLVNAWAIGRDSTSWTNPDKFQPERFLGSTIDFKGQDFELIPFGAGRRMCPGVHLGTVNFELTLANLLNYFQWELPVGVKRQDIDTNALPGIAMHKKNPLYLTANKF